MSSHRHRTNHRRFERNRARHAAPDLREIETRFISEVRNGGSRADELVSRLLNAVLGERPRDRVR